MKLSLSQKFKLSGIGLILLIITVIIIAFGVTNTLNKTSKTIIKKNTESNNILMLSHSIKDYLSGTISLEVLELKLEDHNKFMNLPLSDTIENELLQIEKLRQEMDSLEEQIKYLTEKSISLSNKYIEDLSEGKVNKAEQRALYKAINNINHYYHMELWLSKLRNDTAYKKEILEEIGKTDENLNSANRNIKSAKYKNYIAQSKNVNAQLKQLIEVYSEKIEKEKLLRNEVNEEINKVLVKLNDEQMMRLHKITKNVKAGAKLIIILIILMLFSILGLNFSTSRILRKFVIDLQKTIKKLSEGDLTAKSYKAYLDRDDELGEIARNLDKMQQQLSLLINQIKTNSQELKQASEQLAQMSQQISTQAQQQAATSEELTASMEEFHATVQTNTDNAEKTGEITNKTAKVTEQSSKIFFETIKAVSEITEKIDFIAEVADRTDILSINASIEAARAGEAGKGFAVVAQEIRKLADHTQKSSLEIRRQSEIGRKLSELARKKLEQLTPEIMKSARLVDDIVNANKEQVVSIETINNAILELSQIASRNSQLSEEMSVSAEELASQALMLNKLIVTFKTDEQEQT